MVSTEERKSANPLDAKMTSAQVARRKFKSGLPRKPQDRHLSVMEALGTTFLLLDRFRAAVAEANQDPATTVLAALAYCLPESDPGQYPIPLIVPEPSLMGQFCDTVMALESKKPLFLGVVFIQVDPDAEKQAYQTVSFVVPFMGGPEAVGRLRVAQKELVLQIEKTTLERLTK